MMENKMFCFQCQETAKGTGCTVKGVCGKEASTSNYQDLLLGVVRGVATIDRAIRKAGVESVAGVDTYFVDVFVRLYHQCQLRRCQHPQTCRQR